MGTHLRAQQDPPQPPERDVDPRRPGPPNPAAARGPEGLTPATTEIGVWDAVIIGGGVAGLWTRAVLEARGRSTILIEHRALGAAQTIASQGILHAGVKYALGGHAGDAARAVAGVQATWQDCLAGRDAPDLRAVRIASSSMHMWTAGAASRMAAWGASKAMRSGVRKLDARPDAFKNAPKRVAVYEIEESITDPQSLLSALRASAKGSMIRARTGAIETNEDGAIVQTDLGRITAGRVILCAGAGNEPLLRMAGIDPAPLTQRRPLHMVLVRGAPFVLNGHCLQMSETPRLTITSSHDSGRIVWYIGGALAESGVDCTDADQIDAAKRELHACLPWTDLTRARWATLRVDRAEARTPGGRRPDSVVVREFGRIVAVWPTKLVLAPLAAGHVADLIDSDPTIAPAHPAPSTAAVGELPQPHLAEAPWTTEGFRWT